MIYIYHIQSENYNKQQELTKSTPTTILLPLSFKESFLSKYCFKSGPVVFALVAILIKFGF